MTSFDRQGRWTHTHLFSISKGTEIARPESLVRPDVSQKGLGRETDSRVTISVRDLGRPGSSVLSDVCPSAPSPQGERVHLSPSPRCPEWDGAGVGKPSSPSTPGLRPSRRGSLCVVSSRSTLGEGTEGRATRTTGGRPTDTPTDSHLTDTLLPSPSVSVGTSVG